jgi:hypothetical protein
LAGVNFAKAYTGNNLTTITARQYVTNTVHIAGGHLTTPYNTTADHTEYILDSDITADSTAINIRNSYVVINLNGYTITYSMKSPGYGITTPDYGTHDIGITYGQIIQAPSKTSFTQAIDASQTSISVVDASVFQIGETALSWDHQSDQTVFAEHMLVANIVGNTLTVTRGTDGTTAVAHDLDTFLFSNRAQGQSGGFSGRDNNPIYLFSNYTQIAGLYVQYSGLDVM